MLHVVTTQEPPVISDYVHQDGYESHHRPLEGIESDGNKPPQLKTALSTTPCPPGGGRLTREDFQGPVLYSDRPPAKRDNPLSQFPLQKNLLKLVKIAN